MEKVKMVLWSPDTGIATLVTVIVGICLPQILRADFAVSFYGVGISVLSIVFSLFFAALAIIMASPDNEFIDYLEEGGHYTDLMFTFKFTLIILFVSLGYSIILNVYTDFFAKTKGGDFHTSKIPFVIFVFLFTYSLVSTGLSVKDTLMFSKYRITFLNSKRTP